VAGLLLADAWQAAAAQPVQRYVTFASPSASVYHDPGVLQRSGRRIAVVRSEQTVKRVPGDSTRVANAVRDWETLFLGLQIPYEILHDANLNRPLSNEFQVVVLPEVEALSALQRRRLTDYVAGGGGLILSGRTGFLDENGLSQGADFLEHLLKAKYIETLPEQKHGLYQSIDGSSTVSQGVSPGFLLNVHAQQGLSAVRPRSGEPIGTIRTFEASDLASFEGLTLMHYGAYEQGRVFWTRFSPQDVSRAPGQQDAYQALIINVLAAMSHSATASIATWPSGHAMAMTVAALSAPGFEPLTYYTNTSQFIDFASENGLSVSYYPASAEVQLFPSLFRRMIESGAEIGLSSVDDELLLSREPDEQVARLSAAMETLGLKRAHGVYPPGGFLSPNTIRALDRVQADYVLVPDVAYPSPEELDWWRYADYTDAFVREVGTNEDDATADRRHRLPRLLKLPLADAGMGAYGQIFERARRAGGLFVLPVYPELFRPYDSATTEISGAAEAAKKADAWFATASDVYLWWRRRATLRPKITYVGDSRAQIEIEKAMADTLREAVLEIRIPGLVRQDVTAVESGVLLPGAPESALIRIRLDPISQRRTIVEVSWDHRARSGGKNPSSASAVDPGASLIPPAPTRR